MKEGFFGFLSKTHPEFLTKINRIGALGILRISKVPQIPEDYDRVCSSKLFTNILKLRLKCFKIIRQVKKIIEKIVI